MDGISTTGTIWIFILLIGVPICCLCIFGGYAAGSIRSYREGLEDGKDIGCLDSRFKTWCKPASVFSRTENDLN